MGNELHAEIFKLLVRCETSYANPMNSQKIGEILQVTPSYIRTQLSQYVRTKLVRVRRGNGGGYYLITEERRKMQSVGTIEKQFEEFGTLLEDMKEYLKKLEEGCLRFPELLDGTSIAKSLEMLTQIMDGLNYYLKLLKSAAALLTIDLSEIIYENMSISSLFDHLSQIYTSIFESVENEDYSLLADLIQYDLLPAICLSQGILVVVQERYQERVK